MTNNNPNIIFDQSIDQWDDFYTLHYPWLYQIILKVEKNESISQKRTQQVLTKILLSSPDYLGNRSKDSLALLVGSLFPELKLILEGQTKNVAVEELVKHYYTPN
jgi:hypothetical protein